MRPAEWEKPLGRCCEHHRLNLLWRTDVVLQTWQRKRKLRLTAHVWRRTHQRQILNRLCVERLQLWLYPTRQIQQSQGTSRPTVWVCVFMYVCVCPPPLLPSPKVLTRLIPHLLAVCPEADILCHCTHINSYWSGRKHQKHSIILAWP